jgi:putative salt-induced outer membrane protein YdiY
MQRKDPERRKSARLAEFFAWHAHETRRAMRSRVLTPIRFASGQLRGDSRLHRHYRHVTIVKASFGIELLHTRPVEVRVELGPRLRAEAPSFGPPKQRSKEFGLRCKDKRS